MMIVCEIICQKMKKTKKMYENEANVHTTIIITKITMKGHAT